jgi:sensor histidine kinase YesM
MGGKAVLRANLYFYAMVKPADAIFSNIHNDRMLRFLVSPRYRLFRHLLLLLAFSLLLYKDKPDFVGNYDWYVSLWSLGITLLLLYTNLYLFVPRILLKGRYIFYTIAVLSLSAFAFLVFILAEHFILQYIRREPLAASGNSWWVDMLGFTVILSFLFATFTAIKLFQRWVVDTYRIHELEKSTMQSELDQLKSQINPHFLFNMLNNANVLTQKDPQKASEVLMRLSDLLRYQLYDSTRNKVLLSSDIHFLSDFLNLEKIRRDNFEFTVYSQGDTGSIMIPPFLFTTFVENAVKHNMDAHKASYVHLNFRVEKSTLYFSCVNSKPAIPVNHGRNGGLGLANAKRRLALLYPKKHVLDIQDNTDIYTLHLSIPL